MSKNLQSLLPRNKNNICLFAELLNETSSSRSQSGKRKALFETKVVEANLMCQLLSSQKEYIISELTILRPQSK